MNSILYLPVVRRKFDAEAANQVMQDTLQELDHTSLVKPKEALGTPEELAQYLSDVRNHQFAGIIFHNLTFTDAEFIKLVHEYYPETPILLLAPREPSVGGWPRLNALNGIISSGNYLKSQKHEFEHIYGDVTEKNVINKIQEFTKSASVKQDVENLTIGVVGTYPPGFFFSDANAKQLHATFGTKLNHYEINQAFDLADQLSEPEFHDELEYAKANLKNLDLNAPETFKFVRFAALMKQYSEQDNLGALASRCWPDFFDTYHSAPGTVWSQLSDQQLPTAMECDIHGALSMYILQQMSDSHAATFLGDFSNMDPEDNTLTTWHDYGAYSLANPKYGVEASVHPNRKVPVSPQAVLKPGEVTMLRVHYDSDGYQLIVMNGKVLDTKAQFNGFSGKVQMKAPVDTLVGQFVENGYESHFALVYGDYAQALSNLAKMLGIPLMKY